MFKKKPIKFTIPAEKQRIEPQKIGFISMQLENELHLIAKFSSTTIKEIIDLLCAMIDSNLKDEDLKTPATKSGFGYAKAKERLAVKIWKKIKPKYKGGLKGNQYFTPITLLIDQQKFNMLSRFKPYRKSQKP